MDLALLAHRIADTIAGRLPETRVSSVRTSSRPVTGFELVLERPLHPSTTEVELVEGELDLALTHGCRLVFAGSYGLDGRPLPPGHWCVIGVVAPDDRALRHELARCEGAIERTAADVARRAGLVGSDYRWTARGARFLANVDRAAGSVFAGSSSGTETCRTGDLPVQLAEMATRAAALCRAFVPRFRVVVPSTSAAAIVRSALASAPCECEESSPVAGGHDATAVIEFRLPGRFDTIDHPGPSIRITPLQSGESQLTRSVPASADLVDGLPARLLEQSRGQLPPWAAPLLARVIPSKTTDRDLVDDLERRLAQADLSFERDECNESTLFRVRRAFEDGAPLAVVISWEGRLALRCVHGQEEERFECVGDVVARLRRAAAFRVDK